MVMFLFCVVMQVCGYRYSKSRRRRPSSFVVLRMRRLSNQSKSIAPVWRNVERSGDDRSETRRMGARETIRRSVTVPVLYESMDDKIWG